MKRLFVLVVLLLAAAIAQAAERDVLVTPDGVVYSVETEAPGKGAKVAATNLLTLSVQSGEEASKFVIPESTSEGLHVQPALAYDSESETLFVLWMRRPNVFSSELLLASYKDGEWQPTIAIDQQPYLIRSGLRLGITRRVSQLQKDGSYEDVPKLLFHLLWWEQTGAGEEARYALLEIDHGKVTSSEIHSVAELSGEKSNPVRFDPTVPGAELLRHPAFLASKSGSTVEILSGDLATNALRRTTFKVSLDTRIRIPVGRTPKDVDGPRVQTLSAPSEVKGDWSGSVDVISSAHTDRLVFAKLNDEMVSYLSFDGKKWGSEQGIVTSAKLSAETAMNAVARMVDND